MKISVVVQSAAGWHISELQAASERRGCEFEVVQISAKKDLALQAKSLGDVVIWRSAFLDHAVSRPTFGQYLKSKIVVNDTLFKHPNTPQKYYQQKKLTACSATKKYAIPTYIVKEGMIPQAVVDLNSLALPLIMKPNLGAMGVGVELIKDSKDQKLSSPVTEDMVIQPFVPNDGDWRVFVLGGSPLGAIKRIARPGSHLNNISQGASAVVETDPKVLSAIYGAACKATSAMGLRVAGVDIIKDIKTGSYSVLETNSAPQWDGESGFQSMTGVNVADELVDYAIKLYERDKVKKISPIIEDTYKRNIINFPADGFHFASRMWLWNGDDWSRQYLDNYQDTYLGSNPKAYQHTVDYIMSRPTEIEPENARSPHRLPYYNKYPELRTYVPLLFKCIFAQSVYGVDLRPYIAKRVSDEEFLYLFHKLISDKDAIRILSTHAINYFYLLKFYFRDSLSKSTAVMVDPTELLEIAKEYQHLIKQGVVDKQTATKLKIYLLTHAIIGESRFYQRVVSKSAYSQLCEELEKTITDEYFDVTLDNKLEFLVCCKLARHRSNIKKLIWSEARNSFSWAGNFLVDTCNAHADDQKGHVLRSSEHRNVLYLMSKNAFKQKGRGVARTGSEPLLTLGRLVKVEIPAYGLRLIARVDSGASSSSLAASSIKEEDGELSFKIGRRHDPFFDNVIYKTKSYNKTVIKTTTKREDIRYSVTMQLLINGKEVQVAASLSDREHMLYPMLIGRDVLTGRYIVNTAVQFARREK